MDEIFEAAREQFGADAVRKDQSTPKRQALDFPVLLDDGDVVTAGAVAPELDAPPAASFGYVFIDPDRITEASHWLAEGIDQFSAPKIDEETT